MSIDLIVCNILVIVTYLYCIFWKDDLDDVTEPEETRDHTGEPGKSTDVGVVPSSTEASAITFTEISESYGGTVRTYSTFESRVALESGVTTAQTQSGSQGLNSGYDDHERGA